MIYFNVYIDPKMSEQICIELKENWVVRTNSFYKIGTSIFAMLL